MRKFVSVVAALAAMLVSSIAFAQQWEEVGTIDGVEVAKKRVPGSDLFAFRGEVIAEVHIGRLMSIFKNPNERSKWVAKYADHKTLEKTSTFEEYWIHFDVPFPASDRDYVLRSDGHPEPSKRRYVCKIKSIERADAGENDCCVRATANGTYYRFEALPGDKPRTKLYVEVHTDPKGMLPDWLVNMIQKKWPSDTLNGLIREATRGDVAIHPDYADWHD